MGNNVIVLLSDEHSPLCMGNMKHYICKTPNLDKLSKKGTKFINAYCTSPICVPSRAGLATGLYTFQNKNWDNAFPYDGRDKSWAHTLTNYNLESTSIGKLHFKDEKVSTGFTEQIQPMHVINGIGDIRGSIRVNPLPREGARKYIDEAGIGTSSYQKYDIKTSKKALEWLSKKSQKSDNKNWVLFVSYTCPHFPLVAPKKFTDMYPLSSIRNPINHDRSKSLHPSNQTYADLMGFNPIFTENQIKKALRSYYALVTFIDYEIGKIINYIEGSSLKNNTTIIYTSDHGDNVGRDGLFGKSTMYEESVGVPLIVKGKNFKKNFVCKKNVSHIDLYKTILLELGIKINNKPKNYLGISLQETLKNKNRKYPVISEYHATCSLDGITMMLYKNYKFIYHINYKHQLFDLNKDPNELNNLSENKKYKKIFNLIKSKIEKIVDPKSVNLNAKKDQKKLLKKYGGRKNILSQGTLGYTPTPGEKPDISVGKK